MSSPSRWAGLGVGGVLLFLGGLLFGRYGLDPVAPEAPPPQLEHVAAGAAAACARRVEVMNKETRRLREELAYMKQSVLVEQESCHGVHALLVDKASEISKLTEQLAFYRGIVTPEDTSVGVRIYKLELDPLGLRRFQFRLTLLQSVRQAADATGDLQVDLVAVDPAGKVQTLDMGSLMVGENYAWTYKFRYYTEMYGQFRLPDKLTPLRIEVQARPHGERRREVSATFVWNELISAPSAEESKQ